VEILFSQFHHHPLDDVKPVVETREVVALQERVRKTRVERSLGDYLAELAGSTRRHPSVKTGCSPRGTLALFRASQARAFLEGRDFVIPEDVKAVAVPVLAHRLALDTKAKYSGVQKEDIVREALETVPVGV
jgi:MoxR-like ATPase